MPEFLRSLWFDAPTVRASEQWRAALGAVLAVLFTGALSALMTRQEGQAWLVAPIGASAVLLLALPSSPLTQPWSVIAGNTLSALVGLAASHWIPEPHLAAGLAVGAAILTMFCLRCLHPPGGAVALLTVLTQTHDWLFALNPVLLNSIWVVLLATVYNRLTGRVYPHPKSPPPATGPATPHFTTDDLDAALRHYNQVIDMDLQDLQTLLHDAQAHAYQRTLGQLRCRDIMSTGLITASAQEPLSQAWQRLMTHSIKALPVVNASGQVTGILTRSDVMAHWHGGNGAGPTAEGQESVAQLMTREVRVARDTTHLIDLLPLFSHEGHHHLPIVNDEQVLVGMVTESDVVRALQRALS